MNITNKRYSDMVDKASPKSRLRINCLNAFLVGGLICVSGQALTEAYRAIFAMDIKDARCLTSISLVFIAAVLTGLSLYDNIAKYAGAGTLVPITGFSNAVVSPAIEFQSEGLVMGLGAKMFIIAGPVIVYGTAASVVYGLILCTIDSFA